MTTKKEPIKKMLCYNAELWHMYKRMEIGKYGYALFIYILIENDDINVPVYVSPQKYVKLLNCSMPTYYRALVSLIKQNIIFPLKENKTAFLINPEFL